MMGTVALTVAADQVSKAVALAALAPGERVAVAGRFFGFVVARNSGAAFSMLPGRGLFLAWTTAAIVGAVAVWALASGEFPVALGLVVGGGLGNLADRIFRSSGMMRGKVVDFIDFSFWPTFNLADAAITVGVALVILKSLRKK